ncbi:hypothetical protein VP01_2818g4 [Puccinia sorghi]|uniref:Uncharacterized protein n=1 Tax=Puccinia sorghi TaxID=27349 RepID=A0A0L6V2D5_9BASI|nr:hypothetical protein VP01_2818g4 [Puccinia sorghi]
MLVESSCIHCLVYPFQNKGRPGVQRNTNGLKCRWKNLQKNVLLFTSIYNQISKNPASGSQLSNWIANPKQGLPDAKEGSF